MLTCDTLYNGGLIIYQEKEGYRFSLDAVLLAGLTCIKPGDRVMDLGTGSGVIPLILARRSEAASLIGIEIQSELAALANKNVDVNGLADRIRIIEGDYRRIDVLWDSESCDVVFCNPPYRRLQTGRINPHRQRAVARHELTCTLADVFQAASHLLVRGGRLAVIYPASRLGYLLRAAEEGGFSSGDLTVIHSYADGPGRLVHFESRNGGGEGLRIAPPFVVYQKRGVYTESMQALYRI